VTLLGIKTKIATDVSHRLAQGLVFGDGAKKLEFFDNGEGPSLRYHRDVGDFCEDYVCY